MTVKAVALDRLAASFPNGMFERGHALLLGSCCPCHMENFFFQNCAVQIIDAVAEGDLCQRQAKTDPVSRQMVDIIQVNAANGEVAKLLKRGDAFDVGENRSLRLEGKRHKAGKATCLVLQLAELAQMIDAMSRRLDVSVEHGTSAAATHFVPGAMDIAPFSSGFFPTANCVANGRIENPRDTASNRTETGIAQSFEGVTDRHAKDPLRKVTHFDSSECFDVKIGIQRPQLAQKPEIPVFLQGRMQSANHVHLGDSEAERIAHHPDNFVNCVFKGVCIALLSGKRAELAG